MNIQEQLEQENKALRSALLLAKQHIAEAFGVENWRIEQVNNLASAAGAQRLDYANATCDGCGNQNTYVQVINRSPAANACLCRGCMEIEAVEVAKHASS